MSYNLPRTRSTKGKVRHDDDRGAPHGEAQARKGATAIRSASSWWPQWRPGHWWPHAEAEGTTRRRPAVPAGRVAKPRIRQPTRVGSPSPRACASNGVPNFPDSAVSVSGGRVELNVPAGVDTNSSQFQSAEQTCRKDLPNGGSSGSGSSSGSSTQAVINFSNCMRSHGVPNFPEPNSQGQTLITGNGINPNSPQFQSALQSCQHLLPAGAVGS